MSRSYQGRFNTKSRANAEPKNYCPTSSTVVTLGVRDYQQYY